MCRCVFLAYHHQIKKNFGAGCRKNSVWAHFSATLQRFWQIRERLSTPKKFLRKIFRVLKQKSFHGNFHKSRKTFFISAKQQADWSNLFIVISQFFRGDIALKSRKTNSNEIPLSFIEAVCAVMLVGKNFFNLIQAKFRRLKIITDKPQSSIYSFTYSNILITSLT